MTCEVGFVITKKKSLAYKYTAVIVAHFLFSSAQTQPLALYFAHVRFILLEPRFINVDVVYCEKIAAFLSKTPVDKDGIRSEIISRMRNAIENDQAFVKFLEQIDFSRYVVTTAYHLHNLGQNTGYIEVVMGYQGCPTFIPFESISRIEVIGYETRYSISTKTSNYTEIIPPVYPIARTFPLDDKTAD